MEYYSFVEFANILNNDNIVIDKTDKIYYIKELYDSYTKYLMVCKYNIDNIKVKRMYSIINNYIDFYGDGKNYDRAKLENEYKNRIIDNFNKKLNPPKSFFTTARRDYLDYEYAEKIKEENCDINNHYKNINKKYEYYNNLEKNTNVNTDDTDELYLYEDVYEEDNASCSYNSDDYYYDNDVFSDEESDYYSDDLS
jgi:hypothetical protein